MLIRPASAGDIEPLLDMWCDLNGEGAVADARYRLRPDIRSRGRTMIEQRWLNQQPPRVLVASDESGLVGFIAVKVADEHPMLDRPVTLTITDAYVRTERRREGVGRALFGEAQAQAIGVGATTLELGTLAMDDRAVAFWRALGFEPWRVTLTRQA